MRQHKNTAATNLELLNLVLVKHGEDVAGGALGPLLRGATTAGGLTGGHDFCKAFPLFAMHPQYYVNRLRYTICSVLLDATQCLKPKYTTFHNPPVAAGLKLNKHFK